MRSLLFLVMTLSLAAHAQPLEGPWVAREFSSDFTVNNPHLCVRADSLADLFIRYQQGQTGQIVNHSVFDLDRHELAVTPHDLALPAGGSHHIEDAHASGSDWYLLVTGLTSSTSGMTGGTLFRGRNQSAQQNVLFEDYWHGLGWYGGSMLVDCHLSERLGGGVIVSGLIIGAWGWEIDTWVWTVSVPHGSVTPVWACSVWPSVFIPNTDNAHAVSIEGDSALSVFHHYGGNTAAISVFSGTLDSLPPPIIFPCPLRVLKLARTEGGRVLCLSGETWLPDDSSLHCLELARNGACHLISAFSTEFSLHAAAWHPQYGFAATFGSPSFLLLARIDTNGTIVHPLGVLHTRDPQHVITESDVAITDDGRVVAAWLEQTESQPIESRLMLASVGWDTYLEAEDSRFIPHPSSLILSTFPNPFNHSLRIAYELPHAQEVELAVFNTLGQQVETLRNGRGEAGQHEATWTPHCAGGLYFIRLTAGSQVKTTKVLFVP
ncbi:T9SS type A sorting domain-containing protein [bacterium]|nr:T9SS type A sorting domain-containing protein [bacterium]MBU1984497.1 T9SS type A sorting domain-containing protein [bacterium]